MDPTMNGVYWVTLGNGEEVSLCWRDDSWLFPILFLDLYRKTLTGQKIVKWKLLNTEGNVMISGLTWTCHVCKEERPNALISVLKKSIQAAVEIGVIAHQNIRYCNDRQDCVKGAREINLVGRGTS